ncbi:MAG: glycosyltransferase family 2 protein [Gammaproteobacteria bacterium]|jgi:glycosyltransferase involved in cell wall biosynthesis
MNLHEISVTILTKSNQKYLPEVLQALIPFGEVVLYDNGSTDNTLEIAAQFPNVNIMRGTFEGFGPTHNEAVRLAKFDWILSIDADEIVSEELANELASAQLDPKVVYSISSHNYFNGKWIKGCGWYPDRKLRLFNRLTTKFSDAQVHESVITKGLKIRALKGHLVHYSYDTISDFLRKMQNYSTLFASQYCGKRKSSLGIAIVHGVAAFIKSYVIKRGFLDGFEGFVISAYNGHTAYYKYLKLREANLRIQRS